MICLDETNEKMEHTNFMFDLIGSKCATTIKSFAKNEKNEESITYKW